MNAARRLWASLLLVWLAGCGARPDLDRPPEVRLGEDVCTHCKMIISESRFAAAAYDGEGAAHRFDDIGCLLRFVRSTQGAPGRVWVHVYQGEGWLRVEEALFLRSREIHTAMGSGIVAMRPGSDALEKAPLQEGSWQNWDELMAAGPDE